MHKLDYRFNRNKQRKGMSYKAIMGPFKKALPSCVDLRTSGFVPAIENQGSEGDCAAHATAGAIEFLQLMDLANEGSVGPFTYGDSFERVSRQQLYWDGRAIEGSTGEDSGIGDLADMAIVARDMGVARESLWPYEQEGLFNPPPQNVLDDAALHKLPEFYALSPGYQLKHCLWSGFPFMLGFQVFESFMTDAVAKTGEMPMPQQGEQIVGGHAVLAVGYDDARQCFIVRNSWGGAWGIDGYFHMPYDFIDSQYAGDFVTLRTQPTLNP
jgi:C1A family cysteine protease